MAITLIGTDNSNGVVAAASAKQGCDTIVDTAVLLQMFREGRLSAGTLYNIASCLDAHPEMAT